MESRSASVTAALEARSCVFCSAVVSAGAGRFFDPESAVFLTRAEANGCAGCSERSTASLLRRAGAQRNFSSATGFLGKVPYRYLTRPVFKNTTSRAAKPHRRAMPSNSIQLPNALLPNTRQPALRQRLPRVVALVAEQVAPRVLREAVAHVHDSIRIMEVVLRRPLRRMRPRERC